MNESESKRIREKSVSEKKLVFLLCYTRMRMFINQIAAPGASASFPGQLHNLGYKQSLLRFQMRNILFNARYHKIHVELS